MNTLHRITASAALVAWLLCGPAIALGDSEELEPNDTCETAQALGYLSSLPHTVRGRLDPEHDIDFFAFDAAPGAELVARLLGAFHGEGSLYDPFLGLFSSDCDLVDQAGWLGATLRFEVPADGRFVLAATGCCDWDFAGDHWQIGSYALVVEEAPPAIGSISGRIIDSATGQGLPGSAPTYAWASLYRCDGEYCWDFVTSTSASFDGRFEFATDYLQRPIEIGSFMIEVFAMDYAPALAGPYAVGASEHLDIGDIALDPPPIVFHTVSPCDNLPSGGGTCRYSVEIRNNTADGIAGLAWSNVKAQSTGSPYEFSHFTAARHRVSNIRGMSSTTVRFSFDVPAGVADGAFMCVDAWFSDRDNAFLGTIMWADLFCVVKADGIFHALESSSLPAGLMDSMQRRPGAGRFPAKRSK
jgi:hypothetical protein